jgi:putative SOS response-associated peptidase YedK
LVFTDKEPMRPQVFRWGMVPYWTRTAGDAAKIALQTLNARGETIFEKPAFRESAKYRRCLIYLDAWYEHHHSGKNTYPFRIGMKDGSPLPIAGLWDEWADKETGEIHYTASIVTTAGNRLLSLIHNNSKAEMGPRMPVILHPEKQNDWLIRFHGEEDKKMLSSLIRPLEDGLLEAWSVGRLRGKDAVGNRPEVLEKVSYPVSLNLDC